MKDSTGYSLIDRKVFITDKDSIYYNEWGTVKHYDGEYFHIAIADETDHLPIFNRDQFTVSKTKLTLSGKMKEIEIE
jgi:hypothetical protein